MLCGMMQYVMVPVENICIEIVGCIQCEIYMVMHYGLH